MKRFCQFGEVSGSAAAAVPLDKFTERSSWKATHRGEFQGIPPTGKSVFWTEIHIYLLEKGKIMELWSEADLLGVMIQLSHLFPSP